MRAKGKLIKLYDDFVRFLVNIIHKNLKQNELYVDFDRFLFF